MRDVDPKGRSLIGGRLDDDVSARLLDDSVCGGQAQTRSLPDLLGREEGLEHAGQRGGVHPRAGVAHREEDVGAGPESTARGAALLSQLHIGGLDGEDTALGHRIASVYGKVDENLLDLAGVGLHPSEGRVHDRADLDVLADEADEHGLDVGDDGIQVDDLRLEDLLAAERQELLSERGAASHRLAYP